MSEAGFSEISKLAPILTNIFVLKIIKNKFEYCIFNCVHHQIIQGIAKNQNPWFICGFKGTD
jgi:hypothetical protein